MSKVCGIYAITHIETGRQYVGQSVDVVRRWAGHCAPSAAKRGNHLALAIQKYGKTAFTFQVLEECPREYLDSREVAWLAELDCMAPKGFNFTAAGQTYGRVLHPESRQKLSNSQHAYIARVGHAEFCRIRGFDQTHSFTHVDGRCIATTCNDLRHTHGCAKSTYLVSGVRDQADGWMLTSRVAELRLTKPFIFRLTYEHADGRRVQATVDEMRKQHGANHHISSLHKGRLHTSQGWKLITEEVSL